MARQKYPGTVEHIIIGDDHPTLDELEGDIRKLNPRTSVCNLHAHARNEAKGGVLPFYPPSRTARVRNLGLSRANGRYIAHLDDDNEYEPDHLASLADILDSAPEVGVAFSARRMFWPDGTPFVEETYPWTPGHEVLAQYLYEELRRKGVFRRGSNVVRDMVSAPDGEVILTVDTSELMVRRSVHTRFPFTVRYPVRSIIQYHSDDYDLVKRLHEAGITMVGSGRATVRYYLRGRFKPSIVLPELL